MTDNQQFTELVSSSANRIAPNDTFTMFTPEQRASLFKKIATVTGRLRNIQKDKKHPQGWMYASWESIATAINHELGEANLAFICEMADIGEEILIGKTSNSSPIYRYKIPFRMTLADGDSGAFISMIWWGMSDDSSDKGIEKAATYANKGFLKKTFVIGVGDDPDGESNDYSGASYTRQDNPATPAPERPAVVPRHPKESRPEENQPAPDNRLANALAKIEQANAKLAVELKVDKFQIGKVLARVGVKNPEDPAEVEAAIPTVMRFFEFQRGIYSLRPEGFTGNAAAWAAEAAERIKKLGLHWEANGKTVDDKMIIDTLRNDINPPVLPEVAASEDFSMAALESIVGSDEDETETTSSDEDLSEIGGFSAF